MVDIVDKATRSRMMSGIRSKDTKPEMIIRRGLHARGFRYRLHAKDLPGKPDLVLPKFGAVIFVHGCFWHGHDCEFFKWPKTRAEFWRGKINGNKQRDEIHIEMLKSQGWKVAVLWECATRNKDKVAISLLFDSLSGWLTSAVEKQKAGGLFDG